jgi:hypothetical protein
MIQLLLGIALNLGSLVAVIWAFVTLAELRRGQRHLAADLARLAAALGHSISQTPAITCDHCGTRYDAELTGCNVCGRARPKHAASLGPPAGTEREPRS